MGSAQLTRELTIVAQDPSLRDRSGRIVTGRVRIPSETLAPGPCGYRVHVIDFDATTNTYYDTALSPADRYEAADEQTILGDPNFHCQNVYAIIMATLGRFERALGRRVGWGFYGHQLKVAPHAFVDANAFYSEDDHALLFGYFYPDSEKQPVFTCLSHDIIVHETTHALLDGLRSRYSDPSSPDQAAFHEGFADVVALLSVFSLESLPAVLLDRYVSADEDGTLDARQISPEALAAAIGNLAEEFGEAMEGVRGRPLRNSMRIDPEKRPLHTIEEPHDRGEYFVAAMISAFIELWGRENEKIGARFAGRVDRQKFVEEGARIADILLTTAIRALDYTPPVDVSFSDYLAALLTADEEFRPDDRLQLRQVVRDRFAFYGIAAPKKATERGTWQPAPANLSYDFTHFEPMQTDPDEVFHFVWENRGKDLLKLVDDGYSRILSVRPSVRVAPDGFVLRETVCEYLQVLKVRAGDLPSLELQKPEDMPDTLEIYLYGGGSLIFSEYGRLKYHIYNSLLSESQTPRIAYLWRSGYLGSGRALPFSALHRLRSIGGLAFGQEQTTREIW